MVSDEAKAILAQRGREIQVTSEFGRAYKCVVTQRGNYTMEDYLVFTETFSPILLRHDDILHPQVIVSAHKPISLCICFAAFASP